MNQRMQMIGDWLSEEYTITDLSEMYGVCRKTIYKWIERYRVEGPSGLEERSRAPGSHPNAIPAELVKRVVLAKLSHQKWGPRKILGWLQMQYPGAPLPATSTAAAILKREGLVRSCRRKHRTPPYTEPFNRCDLPNKVWSADFKGQFRTSDGRVCYPLTITDNSSRYILLCRGLSRPSFEEVQPWFEWAFREYGLPEAIRTDNGAPFASVSLGGLSQLSIWFIKLGIRPERIEPGHPEQNGRHERMHRSLKEATAKPPKDNMQVQQRAFDEFVQEYNYERPHEALGQKTPASVYRASSWAYPVKVPGVSYNKGTMLRQIRHNGEIRWHGQLIYLSEALAGEQVALLPKDELRWEITFSSYRLGILNELTGAITPLDTQQREEVLPMCLE